MRKISILEMNGARIYHKRTTHTRVLMNDKNQHHYDDIIIQFFFLSFELLLSFMRFLCVWCAIQNVICRAFDVPYVIFMFFFVTVKLYRSHCVFINYYYSAIPRYIYLAEHIVTHTHTNYNHKKS